MEDSCCSLPISSLSCHEDKALCMSNEEMEEQWLPRVLFNSFHSDTEEEYIEILVSKEKIIESRSTEFLRCKWLRCEAIQWILNMKDYFGFSSQTVYLAVIYLDRFLMQRSIDNGKPWLVQLLTMACLSLQQNG
ncbi:hypothetical protein HPP92_017183 [Vanilla planifolia]|uniref:Cyclin N-terminal domain-containing protein n=1 Tax=Vanilla planifolia TaxID=51239 RepID=A0A835Q7J6_VANPL|nr:hypothetical protein HPP92_017183 [Vanilla planifolia]